MAYSATLTIQAGVKVYFTNPEAELIIEGSSVFPSAIVRILSFKRISLSRIIFVSIGCLDVAGLEGLEVEFLPNSIPFVRDKYEDTGYWKGIEFKENGLWVVVLFNILHFPCHISAPPHHREIMIKCMITLNFY